MSLWGNLSTIYILTWSFLFVSREVKMLLALCWYCCCCGMLLLLFAVLLACFNRTTTTFDGSQKGTEAGWQRWPWHDLKLTERETGDGRAAGVDAACAAAAATMTALPSHPHTHTHVLSYDRESATARAWERECERVRLQHVWYSWRLSLLLLPLLLLLSLPLSLCLSLCVSLALAWFISGRCVWYSFDC